MKVLHVITGLETGGAEKMLYKLLRTMDKTSFASEVVSLTNVGRVGEAITSLGVPVRALGMRRGFPNPFAVMRLAWWIEQSRPDVIQTWMYHADLVGGLAAKVAGDIPLAWGIAQSSLNPQHLKRTTLLVARLCARLSAWMPGYIVSCSEVARRAHESQGYAAAKMVVIPNGFDLDAYSPDATAATEVRKEFGIPSTALLIGLVARFDALKDHGNFIAAASQLSKVVRGAHFLLVGEGVDPGNAYLAGLIDANGLRHCFHLTGLRSDVPRLTAALDIACLSSYSEGFPNVVGEAMACAVPCVVTDVGDSARIVGNTGKVVSARDPAALAAALRELVELGEEGRRALGRAARRRVAENYSLTSVARRYETLYRDMVALCAA